MNEKLRGWLDQIDQWLQGPEGRDLWDVLSALRGPDGPDPEGTLKKSTTCLIRSAAFPEMAKKQAILIWFATPEDGWCVPVILNGDHFQRHVWAAANALGLPVLESSNAQD